MPTTTAQLASLIEILSQRKSVVVSVSKGRAIVAALVEVVGRCHTRCGGRLVWRVEVEGAGMLVVSVSTSAARAEVEGVHVALLGQPASVEASSVTSPRVELIEQLRAQTAQILAGAKKTTRPATRQPSRLELEQQRARAAFGTAQRRPEVGTQEYRRLRAS